MLLDLTTCDHPLDLGTTRKKKKVSSPGVAYIFPALMNEASYRRTGFQTRVSFLPPYVIAFFQRLVDMYLFCFPNKSSRSVFWHLFPSLAPSPINECLLSVAAPIFAEKRRRDTNQIPPKECAESKHAAV